MPLLLHSTSALAAAIRAMTDGLLALHPLRPGPLLGAGDRGVHTLHRSIRRAAARAYPLPHQSRRERCRRCGVLA